MRLIDADALIIDIKECMEAKDANCEWDQMEGLKVALSCIDETPTAEPERKRGKWRHYEGYLTCSECRTEYDDDIMTHCCDDVPKFCPNCGADMTDKEGAQNDRQNNIPVTDMD